MTALDPGASDVVSRLRAGLHYSCRDQREYACRSCASDMEAADEIEALRRQIIASHDPASFATQLAEARAAIRELCEIIDRYSCSCGDMAPPPVAFECENCKAARA